MFLTDAPQIQQSQILRPLPETPFAPHTVTPHDCSRLMLPRYYLHGDSPRIAALRDTARQIAVADFHLLLRGESGVGQRIMAATIHAQSARRDKPFISFDPSAYPSSYLEQALFGLGGDHSSTHSFPSPGSLGDARGGTLYIHDVHKLPKSIQVKLAVAIESGEFYRIGAKHAEPHDVRIISGVETTHNKGAIAPPIASLSNLADCLLTLPPLRERSNDATLTAELLLLDLNAQFGRKAALSAAACRLLQQHNWPDNVRELLFTVRTAFIEEGDSLELSSLQKRLPHSTASAVPPNTLAFSIGTPLETIERAHLLAVLKQCHGNKRETAKVLGLSLKTIYNRVNAYKGKRRDRHTAVHTHSTHDCLHLATIPVQRNGREEPQGSPKLKQASLAQSCRVLLGEKQGSRVNEWPPSP